MEERSAEVLEDAARELAFQLARVRFIRAVLRESAGERPGEVLSALSYTGSYRESTSRFVSGPGEVRIISRRCPGSGEELR